MRDLIAAVVASGSTVLFNQGSVRVVGDVPPDVMEKIRNNREAFLEAWAQYERDRFCKCPPENLPFRQSLPELRPGVQARVRCYCWMQPGVSEWAMTRAKVYQEKRDWTPGRCTLAACLDVLYWQLGHHKEPEVVIEGLAEALDHFRAHP